MTMTNLPFGTVTFLFTDIEGSTKLWEKYPESMPVVLAKHDSILKESIESNRGHIIKTTGDGVHAVFTTAIESVNAAISAPLLPINWNALHSSPKSMRTKTARQPYSVLQQLCANKLRFP